VGRGRIQDSEVKRVAYVGIGNGGHDDGVVCRVVEGVEKMNV